MIGNWVPGVRRRSSAARRLRRVGAAAVGTLTVALAAATAAAAGAGISVPCTGQAALVAAINAANAAGGGTHQPGARCHYALTAADNGENGLPVVTTRIAVNGNGATIDGTGTVRVFEVDGPGGNLSLQNVTITGGSADIGGGIANLGGAVTLNHSQVTGNAATQAGGGIASATFDPSSVGHAHDEQQLGQRQPADCRPGHENGLGGGGIVNLLGTRDAESAAR